MISWVSTEWLRHLMRIIPSGCWEVEHPPACVMSGDHQPYTTNASPARSKNRDSCRFLELIFYVAPPFCHSSLRFPVTSTSLKSIVPTQKGQWALLGFLLPLPLLSAAESQGSGGPHISLSSCSVSGNSVYIHISPVSGCLWLEVKSNSYYSSLARGGSKII